MTCLRDERRKTGRIPVVAYGSFVGWLLVLVCTRAVGEGENAGAVDPYLGKEDDAFFSRQAGALLDEVDKTLGDVPPRIPEPHERRLALLLLDAVVHEPYAPNRPEVQQFYHRRMERAVKEIEEKQVSEGAVIWRLYNHGFVVRTKTVTLAFDLYRGPNGFRLDDPANGKRNVPTEGFPISEALAERLARQCDVLFVSHRHGDHADPFVARAFLAQGKPVVSPPDAFQGEDFQPQITQLKREAHTLQELPIRGGTLVLKVVVYPGQQYQGSGVPNNVVVVFTPEGMSFAHNGDEINDPYPQYQEDFKWIDEVHNHHRIDVLMTNCWLNDIYRLTRGFDPALVIPAHENELGHPAYDRVPYWGDSAFLNLNYPQLLASDYPVLPMMWGESFHFVPKKAE